MDNIDTFETGDGHRVIKVAAENDHSVRISVKQVGTNQAEVVYLNSVQINDLIQFLKPFTGKKK